jgi:hypothetical protein
MMIPLEFTPRWKILYQLNLCLFWPSFLPQRKLKGGVPHTRLLFTAAIKVRHARTLTNCPDLLLALIINQRAHNYLQYSHQVMTKPKEYVATSKRWSVPKSTAEPPNWTMSARVNLYKTETPLKMVGWQKNPMWLLPLLNIVDGDKIFHVVASIVGPGPKATNCYVAACMPRSQPSAPLF